jgi:hypothetical protein
LQAPAARSLAPGVGCRMPKATADRRQRPPPRFGTPGASRRRLVRYGEDNHVGPRYHAGRFFSVAEGVVCPQPSEGVQVAHCLAGCSAVGALAGAGLQVLLPELVQWTAVAEIVGPQLQHGLGAPLRPEFLASFEALVDLLDCRLDVGGDDWQSADNLGNTPSRWTPRGRPAPPVASRSITPPMRRQAGRLPPPTPQNAPPPTAGHPAPAHIPARPSITALVIPRILPSLATTIHPVHDSPPKPNQKTRTT